MEERVTILSMEETETIGFMAVRIATPYTEEKEMIKFMLLHRKLMET